jgi:hypothetical protein
MKINKFPPIAFPLAPETGQLDQTPKINQMNIITQYASA